jgi:hypothetical protein
VIPVRFSSSPASHHWSAQDLARRVSVAGWVARAASPSTTTSASRRHRDRAARIAGDVAALPGTRSGLEPEGSVQPERTDRSHMGLPSSFTVESHVVRALLASGAGGDPASSFSTTFAQFTGGSPSLATLRPATITFLSEEQDVTDPEAAVLVDGAYEGTPSASIRSTPWRVRPPRDAKPSHQVPDDRPQPPEVLGGVAVHPSHGPIPLK